MATETSVIIVQHVRTTGPGEYTANTKVVVSQTGEIVFDEALTYKRRQLRGAAKGSLRTVLDWCDENGLQPIHLDTNAGVRLPR
jgi:hypothetical protein